MSSLFNLQIGAQTGGKSAPMAEADGHAPRLSVERSEAHPLQQNHWHIAATIGWRAVQRPSKLLHFVADLFALKRGNNHRQAIDQSLALPGPGDAFRDIAEFKPQLEAVGIAEVVANSSAAVDSK